MCVSISDGIGHIEWASRAYLPLSREVTVTCGNANQEGIEVDKVVRVKDWVAGLRRGMKFSEDLLGKRLSNPEGKKLILFSA